MRLARIATPSGPRPVVQDGDTWTVITDMFATQIERTDESYPVAGTELLAPVTPVVVLGMARNSGQADREIPAQAFAKSARTVVGPGDAIQLDDGIGLVVAEGELAVVVGRIARNLTLEEAPGAILGWTIGNDVTAADQNALDSKSTQAKNGDGFTPLGPWVETELDPTDRAIEVKVNGESQLRESTAGLARNAYELMVYLTSFMTLGPGDVILTGSPNTAAPIKPGDTAEILIDGIGSLSNPVR